MHKILSALADTQANHFTKAFGITNLRACVRIRETTRLKSPPEVLELCLRVSEMLQIRWMCCAYSNPKCLASECSKTALSPRDLH